MSNNQLLAGKVALVTGGSRSIGAAIAHKLAVQGAEAIVAVLESEQSLEKYLADREVQNEDLTVYAHKLSKAEAQIDWSQSAVQIDRNIRAFNPWPVAFIRLDEQNNLRVWHSKLSDQKVAAQAGEIVEISKHGVSVACGDGQVIILTSLQWPGAKALNAVQILQTQKLNIGQIL